MLETYSLLKYVGFSVSLCEWILFEGMGKILTRVDYIHQKVKTYY